MKKKVRKNEKKIPDVIGKKFKKQALKITNNALFYVLNLIYAFGCNSCHMYRTKMEPKIYIL